MRTRSVRRLDWDIHGEDRRLLHLRALTEVARHDHEVGLDDGALSRPEVQGGVQHPQVGGHCAGQQHEELAAHDLVGDARARRHDQLTVDELDGHVVPLFPIGMQVLDRVDADVGDAHERQGMPPRTVRGRVNVDQENLPSARAMAMCAWKLRLISRVEWKWRTTWAPWPR